MIKCYIGPLHEHYHYVESFYSPPVVASWDSYDQLEVGRSVMCASTSLGVTVTAVAVAAFPVTVKSNSTPEGSSY